MVQLKAVYMVKDISRLSQFYQIPINPPSVSVNTLCELLVKYLMLGDLKSEPVGHSSYMLHCELKAGLLKHLSLRHVMKHVA